MCAVIGRTEPGPNVGDTSLSFTSPLPTSMPTTKKYKGHPLLFAGEIREIAKVRSLKHGEYIAVDNSVLSKHTFINIPLKLRPSRSAYGTSPASRCDTSSTGVSG